MIAAIVYAKLSPFHVARLEAAGITGRLASHLLVGIEVAEFQHEYRWPVTPRTSKNYSLITLFPDQDYRAIPYMRLRRTLYRTLERVRPDVVLLPGWGDKSGLAGLGWCLQRRVPRVLISDSQRPGTGEHGIKRWIKHALVLQFSASFVGGAPHMRYLVELGLPQDRCLVGCDVVDNDLFQVKGMLSGRQRVKNDRPSLLSCLRLLSIKNVQGVLDVLYRDAREWYWTIAGEGPERPLLERHIKSLGLQDRVQLLGHVDYERLPLLYSRADAYLQPSLSETWGLAVNEAMASSLPIIVSDRCGCHEDLLKEGVNGFRFDPVEEGSLAKAFQRLLDRRDDWTEMGETSRQIISDWGLDMFSRNFWNACGSALDVAPERLGGRLSGRAMSLFL
jgi:glycosyltransferase involved in cell wall biosynthesis